MYFGAYGVVTEVEFNPHLKTMKAVGAGRLEFERKMQKEKAAPLGDLLQIDGNRQFTGGQGILHVDGKDERA